RRPVASGRPAPVAQGRDRGAVAGGPVRPTRADPAGVLPVLTPPRKLSPPNVVIVGGGLAGLAAATSLVGRGLAIPLPESRPRLGGRASSFTDPVTGEAVDNCQHVSMACCTNLDSFCRRVGTRKLFRREADVAFLGPEGTLSRLRAGILPAPFHLAGSFL